MKIKEYDNLRGEANLLIKKAGDKAWTLRSCWNCNKAHEHLKKSKLIIKCFDCNKVYFKGVEL